MNHRNVIFIFTDQQRFDTLKVNGSRSAQAPNLDALSQQSVVFREAYAAQPVCTPSRATILTGLYPHSHGLVKNNQILRQDVRCIAEHLDGYRSAYMGKWHLGNETSRQHGFDEWVSIEDYYYRKIRDNVSEPEINCAYHDFLVKQGFVPDGEDGEYRFFTRDFGTRIPAEYSKPAFLAREADRFLGENRDRPFALYINFLEPHPPYRSVNDDLYNPDDIDLPPNFDFEFDDQTPIKYRFKAHYAKNRGRHFPLTDEKAWRKQIARYRGCVTLIDTYVGEVLKSLARHGLEDNTLVVFTSDHGDMMGDMGLLGKGVMFQPSVRVPLLFRTPWLSLQQRLIDGPVNLVDLVPTILEALDQPLPDAIQGKSLYPVLCGEQPFDGDDVFIQYHEDPRDLYRKQKYEGLLTPELKEPLERLYAEPVEERSVVTRDRWRLTLTQTGEHELYNLNEDPLERVNLYGSRENAAVVKELRAKIKAWQARYGDDAAFEQE
ncbi:MAG: hypothetical protein EA404_14650 [Spirochaetaceae bacterium]|nr:MAG: hypothetical protein EA404_14650 [Spirochaetaceae bacterium]